MTEKFEGLFRHILTFFGGYYITRGYIDEQTLMEVIGAIITLTGFFWSWKTKNKQDGNDQTNS